MNFFYLYLSLILFIIASSGILFSRKNLILIIMSIEIMLLAINLNFIFFSFSSNQIEGQLFCLFILTIAAAESAIGLALFVTYHKLLN